jgi:glyoxylase-like metal-dependent hydrolase (beta-lactamase superfamily II)
LLQAVDHQVDVICHADEKPYLEGEKPFIKGFTPERMAQIEAGLAGLPEDRRQATKAILQKLAIHIDQPLVDGEVLPFGGGIVAIHTPGHTPGHLCLYLKQHKVLISGDALNVADGRLLGPNPQFTPDMDLMTKSLEKLTQYDIDTVICYHDGLY